ncbi:MAG: hypothetical protein AAF517_09930 [Planctomycetota bacterium]
MPRLFISLCFVLVSGVCAFGDTVYLKNGAWIDGIVRTRSAEAILVEIGATGKVEIPLEDVERIEKNSRTGSEAKLSVEDRELEVKVDSKKRKSSSKKKDDGDEDEDEDEDDEDEDEDQDEDEDEDEDEGEGDKDEGEPEEEEDSIDPELKERIEKLVKDLQRQRTRDRVRAERHLKAIGAPSQSFLLPLSDHDSDLVRTSVFKLFYSFADEKVVDDCIDALTDSNEYVRDYAHRALRRITDEDFGFKPFSSPRRRERAAGKWRRWWKKEQETLSELSDQARE